MQFSLFTTLFQTKSLIPIRLTHGAFYLHLNYLPRLRPSQHQLTTLHLHGGHLKWLVGTIFTSATYLDYLSFGGHCRYSAIG